MQYFLMDHLKHKSCLLAATFVIFLILTAPVSIQAQSVTNYAAVDSVQVGDTFDYSIVTESPSDNDQIIFPDTSHFGSPISIVNRKRYKVSDFVDSLAYTLQFFGTQSYTIPKVPVRFVTDSDTSTLYVPPVPLDFKSTIKAENPSLLPLKPIFNFAINWWPYLLGLLLLAVGGYLAYRWYQNRDQKPEKESTPFIPQPFSDPLDQLEQNLRQISNNMNLRDQNDFKLFYSKLGDSLRLYLERVYQIPALESTSRELIDDLHREAAPEPLINRTKTVLREADMVKFAKFTPSSDQAQKALEEANKFLDVARQQDRNRIEYLRNKHENRQEELKTEHESEESGEEVTSHV
jgi:hypothetical protein